jgi:hypothetical protein
MRNEAVHLAKMIFHRSLQRIRRAADCSRTPRNPIIQLLVAAAADAAAVNDRESSVAIGVNNMSASTARARVGMRPQSRATKAEECRTIRSSSLTVGIYIHGWGKLLREHTGGCMK